MGLSRKTNKIQYRRKSYRQNKSMIGRGEPFNEQLLLGINSVSRTILESNDNVVNFVDNFLDEMFIVLINEDRYKSYEQINNYLDNNLNKIKKILFESYDMTSEFYENTSVIDEDAAVKCLFYLCLYNHIEKGLRNYRDVAVGGNPFGIQEVTPKGVRRVIGAAASGACAYVGATSANAAAQAVMLGCTGAVGSVAGTTIGTTVCTAVCGYPVLVVGAGLVGAYGAWSVSKHLFNGIYTAALATPGAVRAIAGGLMAAAVADYPDPLPAGPLVILHPRGPQPGPPPRPVLPAPPANGAQSVARPPPGPPPGFQGPPGRFN